MINRFLLFMKMLLTGVFKFIVEVGARLALIFGVVIMVETIARVKILTIILLIILAGVIALVLFIIGEDFWSRYKKERDFRDL